MRPLTKVQEKVLEFLREFAQERGYMPSRQEMAMHFKWRSPNAAEEQLRALERKGCIAIAPGIARGIKVLS